jgi:hypothetical protein
MEPLKQGTYLCSPLYYYNHSPARNLLHLARVLVDVSVAAADEVVLLGAAVDRAFRAVQLVQAERHGNVKHLKTEEEKIRRLVWPIIIFCSSHLGSAVFPMHLASVVV